ncbi:uncharacterized protein J4E78_005804 [Alternaria triticimaculans]|uniref:uncharacterized protein n=1 Tax=Alternaria triticimaculans TaxID=297637 RepID=UPI0020C38416|nr:uncharacterized protein J4E78_005804 [Alternaria triticimaculans]KAI4659377.1 hypothetical protein J4E78_005804 [Alternaria triticimaculans]
MHNILFLLLTALAVRVFSTSQIALFEDDNCQESLRGLEGPNGYPNGTCTDLRRNGPYGSFQVVGLDPGCTVTIYMNDTAVDICSGFQEEIQPIDCYNSTFVYYSIDFCDAAAIGESPSATSTPTPTSTPSSTPPPSGSSGLSTGAIAGAAVGGGIGLGIIIGLAVFFIMRRRHSSRPREMSGSTELTSVTPYEVHAKHIQELGPGAVAYKHEPVEIEQPPVELGGMELRRHEEKGMH